MHTPGVRPGSQGRAHQQPGPPQLLLSPQWAPALAACPGPRPHLCVCNQPLPLHRHLQLALQASVWRLLALATPTTHRGPYPPDLGGTTEDTNSSYSHYRVPPVLAKDHTVDAVNSSGGSWRDITPASCHQTCHPMRPHWAPWTARPGITACSSVPPPTGERLPLLKPRGDYFFKCAAVSVTLWGSWRVSQTWHRLRKTVNSSNWLPPQKKMEIQEFSENEFKRIVIKMFRELQENTDK